MAFLPPLPFLFSIGLSLSKFIIESNSLEPLADYKKQPVI